MKRILLLIVTIIFSANITHSQTFRILHHFDSAKAGVYQPIGSFLISNDTIYGIASQMESIKPFHWKNHEVIYKMHIDGFGFEIIHEFFEKDSAYYEDDRQGSLILVGSYFYGTIMYGGTGKLGIIFKIKTDGTGFSLLHTFWGGNYDGYYPIGKLVYSNSVLYGMTLFGATNSQGTIFKINIDGSSYKILHLFKYDGIDRRCPSNSLMLSDSLLYGITSEWLSSDDALVDGGIEFRMKIDGTDFKYLRSIQQVKWYSYCSSSISKSDSVLYCVTSGYDDNGKNVNKGVLYKLNPDGTGYKALHDFNKIKNDGVYPTGELSQSQDFIYGITQLGGSFQGIGSIYRVQKDGSRYEKLRSFQGKPYDGNQPQNGLVIYKGSVYGTTMWGGKNDVGILFVYRDVIIQDSCGKDYFNFPEFTDSSDIVLNEKAKVENSAIILSEPKPYEVSSVYNKNPMIITGGFRTEFSFRFYNGFNKDNDGSPDGADGITFIIQANSPNETGNSGGGLGYDGIPNSIVIEYDAYKNNAFNDPDGSHVGVFTKGQSPNSPIHQSVSDLGTTSDIPVLKADSTIYYARIEYDYNTRKLKIWLDTTGDFKKPALEINSFDISNILNLIEGKKAYVGFTSATGDSYQNTELLTWSFCPTYDNSIASSVEEADLSDKSDNLISPNPANDYIVIQSSEGWQPSEGSDIKIFDMLGVNVLSVEQRSSSVQRIDISKLAHGIYFIKIGNRVEKFVKL